MTAESNDSGELASQYTAGGRRYRVRNTAKAEERKRAILQGAARVFARRGYGAANMEEIAAEAGLAKGGHIYHYFLSKEEMFTEITVTGVEDSVRELERIVTTEDSPACALRRALVMQISGVFGPLERQALLHAVPLELSPENRQRIRQLKFRYEQLIQGVLEDGVARGVFIDRNPRLMTLNLMRGAFGVVLWYRPGGPWEPDWIVEETADQLMRSVLAPACSQPFAVPPASAGDEAAVDDQPLGGDETGVVAAAEEDRAGNS